MKKGTKIICVALTLVLAAALLAGGLYLKSIRDYKAKVEALTFADINLNTVADGVYTGECATGVVNVRAAVTVKGHSMTDITLIRHDNGRGAPAEAILNRMLQAQTTAVDAVSGATCSSKVIRKAVENALAQGVSADSDVPPLSLTPDELVGPWHLAEGENDDAAINDAIPGAMEFGGVMEIRSNGNIGWYIGAEGGTGTYTLQGDTLHAELTNTMDNIPLSLDFTARKDGDQLLLTTVYKDLPLCWSWGEGETGKGA